MVSSSEEVSVELPDSYKETYKWSYHSVKENNLKCLLISSPEVDMASATMSSAVGSLWEPNDRQGLAHFCEHMLFMGSEKYPDEDEYNVFLNEHGGRSNAYTNHWNTVYYFAVHPDAIEGALDRFSGFFECPLFSQSGTGRELNAVQSEFNMHAQNDSWRMWQLTQHLSNSKHPFSRFMIGSEETLRHSDNSKKYSDDEMNKLDSNLRDELLKFHSRFYCANEMALAIIAKEPIDEQKNMVDKYFGKIKFDLSLKIPKPIELCADEPFPKECKQRKIFAVPVTDAVKSASFNFFLPDHDEEWRQLPLAYIADIVGHEGPGSVLAVAKDRGLVTACTADDTVDRIGATVFTVKFSLTDDGANRVKELGEILFSQLRNLKENGISKERFDELNHLQKLNFRFAPVPAPEAMTGTAAKNLLRFPPELIFKAGSVSLEYNEKMIRRDVELMTPDNVSVILIGLEYADVCTETEPFFKVKFLNSELDPDWIKSWTETYSGSKNQTENFGLSLPPPNEFIPSKFEIKPVQDNEYIKYPKHVSHSHFDCLELLVCQDSIFNLPLVAASIKFIPLLSQLKVIEFAEILKHLDIKSKPLPNKLSEMPFMLRSSMIGLMCSVLSEALNEYTYAASLANCDFSVGPCTAAHGVSGFEISLSGYDEKIVVLLKKVLCALFKDCDKSFAVKHFKVAAERMIRHIKGAAKTTPPYRQASELTSAAVIPGVFTTLEMVPLICQLDELSIFKSSISDFESFKDLFCECHIQCLVEGNLNPSEVKKEWIENSLIEILNDISCSPKSIIDNKSVVMGTTIRLSEVAKEFNAGKLDDPSEFLLISEIEKSANSENNKKVNFIHYGPTSNPEDPNNAVVLEIQIVPQSIQNSAFLNLSYLWLSQPFFDDLRTKQQLGYVVALRIAERGPMTHLTFLVQSTKPSSYVLGRIFEFLNKYLSICSKKDSSDSSSPCLTEESFETLRKGTIGLLEEQPKNIGDQFRRDIGEVKKYRYQYNRKQLQIDFLKSPAASFSAFKKFAEANLFNAPWLAVCLDKDLSSELSLADRSRLFSAVENGVSFGQSKERPNVMMKDMRSLHRMVWNSHQKFYLSQMDCGKNKIQTESWQE